AGSSGKDKASNQTVSHQPKESIKRMATKMSKGSVLKEYKNLEEVLLDKDLAGLGDAYVNLLYSLVVSQKSGHPTGAKVN
ncbi:MAG: hypothetical protein GWN33_02060, partial [Gammaproteobacteria bacterium]|nr:hypothetical protein [Gammaproteobacteria bacterium]